MVRKDACPICGETKEQPTARTCYGCYLDGLVPGEYRFLEGYQWDAVWGHQNASARPRTGVQILDLSRPPRISDTRLKEAVLRHICELEAKQGLDDEDENGLGVQQNGPVVYRGTSYAGAAPI
jgi:transcription initiation factor TFIIIB Brf1 subunit/transcription initiation factor TFIIB